MMRNAKPVTLLAGLFLAGWLGLAPGLVRGQPNDAGQPEPHGGGEACGFTIGAAATGAWRSLGGESGRLGCPTQDERPSSPSPQGSAAHVVVYGLNGEVVSHASGPRAGQAYAVVGCFYRLYVQFSGTSGWLGLPITDAENTPDGSKQTFEGGLMRFSRAYDDCEATPTPPADAVQTPGTTAAETVSLDLYENPISGDRLSLASPRSAEIAAGAGYQRLRAQGRVLAVAEAGAAPLKLYQNEARGLHETLAAPQSERDALANGFVFEAGQGYVWTGPRPGAVALKLYRDPATARARLTAGPGDEREAVAAGWLFERVEGYADPAR